MRAQAKPPRPKWPFIVIGVVVAALIGYALFAIASNQPGPVDPTLAPTASSEPTAPIDALPTGCIAGDGLDAQTLLDAQAAAPDSSTGAVEVAAALMRWAYQYPYPTDSAAVADAVVSAEAPESFRDLEAFFAGNPNLSGGIVADGTGYRLSTVTGVWYLESTETDVVTVSVGAAFVVEGELSSNLKASTTITLRWEDGAWRADQLNGSRTTEDLFAIGTTFTEGC